MMNRPAPKAPAALDAVADLRPKEVVAELTLSLGAQLVAAIAGVKETRRVRAWEQGEVPQRIDTLRAALQANRAIVATATEATARAWFVGCSTALDFVSPLEVLREDTPEARTRVLRAAVSFAQR